MTNPKVTTTAKTFSMPLTFKSLSDIGYQAARYQDTGSILIKSLVDANIGWPDNVSEDNMALIKSGVVLRKGEISPPAWYKVEGKNLVGPTAEAPPKAERDSWLMVNVALVTSYTPHQLGGLKESHPALYDLVVAGRKDVSKYVSNVLARLRSMTKAMAETERARGTTLSIADKVKKIFEDLAKSNKLARDNRGDPTAYADDVLARKIAAFHSTK